MGDIEGCLKLFSKCPTGNSTPFTDITRLWVNLQTSDKYFLSMRLPEDAAALVDGSTT
jgi:hypothetical protein